MTTTYQPVAQPRATIQRQQPAPRPTEISQATAIEQSRAVAEVQAAVVVAQSCPRNMQSAEAEMEYVCGRMDMAEHAFYQVTNRGTGPSVHLMRELARAWGNIDYGVKELARNDTRGESEVQAFAWDIERNTRSSRTFIVPHQRMVKDRKTGERYRVDLNDLGDIYLNNQNVGARAVRECIATILPRWFTEKAQNVCRATLEHGEGEPIQDRIKTMVAWFKDKFSVTEADLEGRVGKKRGQWDAGDVAELKIAGTSLTRGEVTRDELFPPQEPPSQPVEKPAPAKPEPADPTPAEPEVPMATATQVKHIVVALKAAEQFGDDTEGRQARLDWLSAWAERPIKSTKELTKAEAVQLLEMLTPAPEEPTETLL